MEKTYKHFNKEGKAVNVTVPKKPSASKVARAKSAGSFYDKLRKGITGDKTEIVKGAQNLKEAGKIIPDHQSHWDVGVKHGKEAFAKGHTAPALDKQAMSYIKTISGPIKKGSATEVYMRGWHRGHALANLSKNESKDVNEVYAEAADPEKIKKALDWLKKSKETQFKGDEKSMIRVKDKLSKTKEKLGIKEDVYAKVTDPKHDETKKQMSDVKKKISKVKVDKEGHTVGIKEELNPMQQANHSLLTSKPVKRSVEIAWRSQKLRKKLDSSGVHYKGANEAVMNYGAPARNLGHQDVKKPPGYGSPARGGDGNGLGRSSVSKPPGYGSPAKDLTPGTRVGGKAVKVESEGKALRDVIREGEEDERRRTFTAKYGVTGGTMASRSLVPATHRYSKDAVDAAIASSNRHGRKIGGKEAKKIHALLKGWR